MLHRNAVKDDSPMTHYESHFEVSPSSLVNRLHQRMSLERRCVGMSVILIMTATMLSLHLLDHELTQWPDLGNTFSWMIAALIAPALADTFRWSKGERAMKNRWVSVLEAFRSTGGNEDTVNNTLSEKSYRSGCVALSRRARGRFVLILLSTTNMLSGMGAISHEVLVHEGNVRLTLIALSTLSIFISLRWFSLWGRTAFRMIAKRDVESYR